MSHYPHNSNPNKSLKRSATFAATPSNSMGRTHSTRNYWDTVITPTNNDYPAPSSSRLHLPTSSLSSSRPRPISKPFPRDCRICKRTFASQRSYDEHTATCADPSEKPYGCHECGTAFKKNSNLVKHRKLVHRGEKNFQCAEPGCARMFGQKSNLNSHVKAVHLGEKPFVCKVENCGRRFSQKSGLKAHVKTVHNGERPYVCDRSDCGSSFGHRGDVSFPSLPSQPICVSNPFLTSSFYLPSFSSTVIFASCTKSSARLSATSAQNRKGLVVDLS